MKKIRISSKKSTAAKHNNDHYARRVTFGIALVLLGVLTVLNMLVMYKPRPVDALQGADMYQTR